MIYTPKKKKVSRWVKPFKPSTSKEVLYVLVFLTFALSLVFTFFAGDNTAEAVSTTVAPKTLILPKTEQEPDTLEAVQAEDMLKGTPMSGLGALIVQKSLARGVSWKIVIGIAEAESNRGQSYVFPYDKAHCHNPFGIKPSSGKRGDGSYLRCYDSWEDGINTMVEVLFRRYKNQTPEQMNCVYVQPCNPNWVRTVNKYYQQ